MYMYTILDNYNVILYNCTIDVNHATCLDLTETIRF